MRAAIYARFSSENQRTASIEDQVRLCKARIKTEGWVLIATYTDRAQSGASRLRAGYQELLEDARGGQFDVVVAEALDRLSRDQEDVAALYKQLTFSGVKIVTLAEGEITELHVGLKGTMNALFLKDLALKTHRGLEGRVRQGRSGGGLCYGYDIHRETDARGEPLRGGRVINIAEAEIVRRIFNEFVAGRSPRSIAEALNAERVPGPSGHTWTASTIHGNRERGTGILNNELYIGRLVWNRLRYVKDPQSAKRVSRLNPSSLWVVTDVPELHIVENELWAAAKQRQREMELPERNQKVRNALNARHRAQYLLSGLLACGICGARYTLIGEQRYACANHVNRGTCSNRRTVSRAVIEGRVLSGLKDKLLAPELVAEAVREYQAEWNRRAAAGDRRRAELEAELNDTLRRITQVMAAIEQGVVTATTKARLLELEAKHDACMQSLHAEKERALVPALHPGLAEAYRRKVAELESALNDPAIRLEAAGVLRGLIDAVVLYPGERRGEIRAELHGVLAALLQLDQADKAKTRVGETRVSLVAGARSYLYRTAVRRPSGPATTGGFHCL
jgi:DNA invertase Pin-like site-specific DNA recombinase